MERFLHSKQNEGTRHELRLRLLWFDRYCVSLGGTDTVVEKLKIPHGQFESPLSPYEVLGDYYVYLLELNNHKKPVSISTIRWRVNTAKNFIEFTADRELSNKRFKNKVNYGDIHEREPEAITRDIIIKLLTTTYDTRLRIFIHFLASMGCRPSEACNLKLENLNLDSNPPKVHFPASITKDKRARTRQLTREISNKLREWLGYKYRSRNKVTVLGNDNKTGKKTLTERVTPTANDLDLLFAICQDVNPDSIYVELARHFRKLLEITGLDDKYEDGIHKITFGSLRDYVKTQISNATNTDFSEYFIGHKGKYNYYSNDPTALIELFKSVEPKLTFFDKDEVIELSKDNESRIDLQRDEIKALKQRLTKMENDHKESTSRLLSLIAKESIVGKPAIPKSQLDLLLNGELEAIPFAVSDRKGKDVNMFTINRNLESIKHNSKKFKELTQTVKPNMKRIHVLQEPAAEFRAKKRSRQ